MSAVLAGRTSACSWMRSGIEPNSVSASDTRGFYSRDRTGAAVKTSGLDRHVDERWREDAFGVAGVDGDEESAGAAVDVDPRQLEDGALQVHRHRVAQPEGRGAAD